MGQRRFKRGLAWLVAVAVGFGVATLVAWITDALTGDQPDEVDGLVQGFWAFVAFGYAGVVATYLFSLPRPRAGRWLWIGMPALGLATIIALSGPLVMLMMHPLAWFAAFWAALLPYDPDVDQ